jgi:DNA-binding MarR family transcriptional regulator
LAIVPRSPRSIPLDRVKRIAAFRAALRTFLAQIEQASRTAGLTPRWYLMLLLIKGAPDGQERLSFSELAETLKLSPNSVSELAVRVEQAGLVERERSSDDRRVVYLRLTEEGERRLTKAIADTEGDRRQLAFALRDLIDLYETDRGH